MLPSVIITKDPGIFGRGDGGGNVPPVPHAPAPTFVFPSAVKAGQAVTFQIKGTNFDTGNTPSVTIDGIACTSPTTVSSTTISAVTPVGLSAGGPYDVVVTYSTGPNAGTGTLASSFDVFDAHLIAQFDDSSLQNTTAGGNLTAALDLTGNSHVLHQLASANQPVLTSSGMSGLPGVTWTSSPGTGLVDSGTTAWGLSTTLSFCTLVQTSASVEQHIFGMQFNNFHGLLFTALSTQLLSYLTADITTAIGALVCDGNPHACISVTDTVATTAKVYVDGVVGGTIATTATAFMAGNGDRMAWGCSSNDDNGVIDHPMSGFSPCIYVFDVALTGGLLTQVNDNLKRRGSIP